MKFLIALLILMIGFFTWLLCRAASLADRELVGRSRGERG